jgi:hypothetical protein
MGKYLRSDPCASGFEGVGDERVQFLAFGLEE